MDYVKYDTFYSSKYKRIRTFWSRGRFSLGWRSGAAEGIHALVKGCVTCLYKLFKDKSSSMQNLRMNAIVLTSMSWISKMRKIALRIKVENIRDRKLGVFGQKNFIHACSPRGNKQNIKTHNYKKRDLFLFRTLHLQLIVIFCMEERNNSSY